MRPPEGLGADRRAAHILIVDDNETNQRVAAAVCRILGFTCVSVLCAQRAIAAAASDAFNLVLMDICMPGMDGVEAALRIRALDIPASRLPIIAVTANAEPVDCARYLAAGMCAVIAKPIRLPGLCQAMEWALGQDVRFRSSLGPSDSGLQSGPAVQVPAERLGGFGPALARQVPVDRVTLAAQQVGQHPLGWAEGRHVRGRDWNRLTGDWGGEFVAQVDGVEIHQAPAALAPLGAVEDARIAG